jgi:hypothetical protein
MHLFNRSYSTYFLFQIGFRFFLRVQKYIEDERSELLDSKRNRDEMSAKETNSGELLENSEQPIITSI